MLRNAEQKRARPLKAAMGTVPLLATLVLRSCKFAATSRRTFCDTYLLKLSRVTSDTQNDGVNLAKTLVQDKPD
jgi:hypothetical protein